MTSFLVLPSFIKKNGLSLKKIELTWLSTLNSENACKLALQEYQLEKSLSTEYLFVKIYVL